MATFDVYTHTKECSDPFQLHGMTQFDPGDPQSVDVLGRFLAIEINGSEEASVDFELDRDEEVKFRFLMNGVYQDPNARIQNDTTYVDEVDGHFYYRMTLMGIFLHEDSISKLPVSFSSKNLEYISNESTAPDDFALRGNGCEISRVRDDSHEYNHFVDEYQFLFRNTGGKVDESAEYVFRFFIYCARSESGQEPPVDQYKFYRTFDIDPRIRMKGS